MSNRTNEQRTAPMPKIGDCSPWGPIQGIEDLGEGVYRMHTAHGGLIAPLALVKMALPADMFDALLRLDGFGVEMPALDEFSLDKCYVTAEEDEAAPLLEACLKAYTDMWAYIWERSTDYE